MASKKYDLIALQADREDWIDIPPETISEQYQEIYRQRKIAVDMYIDGYKMADIEERTTVKHSNLPKLLERCLREDTNNVQYGYSGLIPQRKINTKLSAEEQYQNPFIQLLAAYSELDTFIKGNYFGIAPYTLERVMNIRTLHEKFLRKCKELQISDDEYPFNTDTQGYYALYRYVKKIEDKNLELAAKRIGKDAQQKLLSTGIGNRYRQNAIAPFNMVQVDGHIIDMIYTIQVRMPDGTLQAKPAHRCWLFVVIDVATRCIIGYSTSQHMNYNQYDVLRALQNSILPHRKIDFKIPGFSYPANGGFPSLAFPEAQYALFDMIMLDNAKAHLSRNVRNKTLDVLNCTLNYGSVATPETRGIVERFFGTLETRGFHRLPMTTDSSTKGVKRRNPEQKAIKYNVTYDDIVEIIEQLIIEYNNSSHQSLYNNTPLQEMERKMYEYGMFPSFAAERKISEIRNLLYHTETRKVCGGKKNGKRPYINFMNAQYRNDLLASSNTYVGKTITILINPDDVSIVEAFATDGTPLGTLRANGERGLKSHSLGSRKAINQYAKQNRLDNRTFSTPITAYEQELERRAPYSKRERTKADILRREEGKSPLLEQAAQQSISPTSVAMIDKHTNMKQNMPTVEEVQNMTAEEMWKYIKRVK